VAAAIADYVRTRMSGNSAFDRWQFGNEQNAVSEDVKRGFALFTGAAQCNRCHRVPLFTDGMFHNTGIGWNAETRTFSDLGRYAIRTLTRGAHGSFKTPGLREVSRHPPYMHDGSIATLREVVEYYNRGGNRNPYLDWQIPLEGLKLTGEQIDDLVAFLTALEGEGWQDSGPSLFPQ
jgi:cytochrome c peroxidase